MLRIVEYVLLAVIAMAIIILSYWLGQQAYSWMPVAASTEALKIDNLFSFLVILGSIVFFGIMAMLVYSIIAYRTGGVTSASTPTIKSSVYNIWGQPSSSS